MRRSCVVCRQNLALLLLSMFILNACKSSDGEKSSVSSASASVSLSEAERAKLEDMRSETEVGRNMAGRLLAFYGRYDQASLADYLNQVAALVGVNSDFADRRFMVDILNSDDINAFACPGGYILVTAGAVRHAQNEAELAMVLGHEIAHVGKRHMFNKLKSMSAEDLEKASDGLNKKLNEDPDLKARHRPKPQQSELGSVLAKYLSGSNAGLNVLAASKAGMGVILEKGLGSELEAEADQVGVKYAIRSGYDPRALVDYLCRMENPSHVAGNKCLLPKAKDSTEKLLVLEKTHPPTKERISTIGKMLTSMNANEMPGAKGTERFKENAKLKSAKKTKA